MELGIGGKVALVTGAGQGMGQAISLGLAAEGVKVTVNDLSIEKANETVQLIQQQGGEAMAVSGDVSSKDDAEANVAACVDRFGAIDILVNNAGIESHFLVEHMPHDVWDRTIGVTLNSAFNYCKAVIPHMKKSGKGKIVAIGSVACFRLSASGGSDYTAAKHGLLGLCKHLSIELGQYGINVNVVCPGLTVTPNFLERYTEQETEDLMGGMPIGRLSRPEDIADAVLFMVSERADMITGQSLVVDCGIIQIVERDYQADIKGRVELSKRTMEQGKT
ncbi:MAG: SDR family oxidoreductase [Deltaproteobacteria bacterium]|nr:SDR family oxidoreductase [Deltaproteobacteria bacterium]